MSNRQAADDEFARLLALVTSHLADRNATLDTLPTTPTAHAVRAAVATLPSSLPANGWTAPTTIDYLVKTLLPGCLTAQNGPRYFGFVTGGVTPAAQLAETLLTGYDENVTLTLPDTSAATAVEAKALEMVLDLLNIPRESFAGRTITTGATGSNVLGMACARDYLYANSPHLPQGYSYAQSGPPSSPTLPSPPIVVLGLHPHFSILKAAALVGIGGGPGVIQSLPADADDELAIDIAALHARLAAEKEVGRGVIVTYGLGEVNTGGFGRGLRNVAALCKEYGAWLHVDGAFGGFAGVLPELQHLVDGIELANSLTLDGHKWLNVPYDCGLFFTRDIGTLPALLGPPSGSGPAYLQTGSSSTAVGAGEPQGFVHDHVPSPLFLNIENSRRFRALPLFASLVSLGKDGYIEIIRRNNAFAQRVAYYIAEHPNYVLLNASPGWVAGSMDRDQPPIVPLNIVLFGGSATSPFPPSDVPGQDGAPALTAAINATRRMYVSGTKWRGVGAVRLAVSNWRTGRDGEDFDTVKRVLDKVVVEACKKE